MKRHFLDSKEDDLLAMRTSKDQLDLSQPASFITNSHQNNNNNNMSSSITLTLNNNAYLL